MSERFARDGINRLEDTVDDLARKLYLEDAEEVYNTLESGLKMLVEARNFLLNSYIAAFGLTRDDVYKHEFETHQVSCSRTNEKLPYAPLAWFTMSTHNKHRRK